MKRASHLHAAAVIVATLLAAWLVATKVRLSPDIGELLPDRGEAAALSRYARAFGGGDPGIVLVEGDDPSEVSASANEATERLRKLPDVEAAYDHVELPYEPTPSQWMLLADPKTFADVAKALTPEGMRDRLSDTRALLLAPGGSALAPNIAKDPLRLGELVIRGRASSTAPSFVSPNGKARLVIAAPKGNALRSEDARRFVGEVEAALADVAKDHATTKLRLTGGHAMAAATESLLRHDLALSSALSIALVSIAFVALFRRARALLAILPPLAAGTVITAAVAALFPRGLSAIAVAFASVVVGVGTDTGVHVYAAVQAAMREGEPDPAAIARSKTARPVLGAALVASCAFACMALSRVDALRQLGILSAVGEVATALAILGVTPSAAVWLERNGKPAPSAPWASKVASWPRGSLAVGSIVVSLLAIALVGFGLGPRTSESLVLVKPRALAPADVYADLHRDFETQDRIPTVLLVSDRDADEARARADALYDALAHDERVTAIDALTTLAPAKSTIAKRLAARDGWELPKRAEELEAALREKGFSPAKFEAALEDLRHPEASAPDLEASSAITRRYLAKDGDALVALYLDVADGADDAVAASVHRIDPAAEITGFGRLEPALRSTLVQDLPRVGIASLVLVLGALAVALRRPRDVALAAIVVLTEIALVLLAMRALSIPLHAYDALVLPVLLGITLDEVLFVLTALREGGASSAREALRDEAPIVTTTALTTAAGFGALYVCRFDALRHLAVVGAVGSAVGVVLALVAVPSVLLAFPAQLSSRPGKR